VVCDSEEAEYRRGMGVYLCFLTCSVLTRTYQTFDDTCEVLLNATGPLNKWEMPDIAGLESYKGPLMHSANYDTSFDHSGKRIALIGGGSSGIQILPQIAPSAQHIDHYMKGRTWIPPFGMGGQGILDRQGECKNKFDEVIVSLANHRLKHKRLQRSSRRGKTQKSTSNTGTRLKACSMSLRTYFTRTLKELKVSQRCVKTI
jgi:hypothetical protein